MTRREEEGEEVVVDLLPTWKRCSAICRIIHGLAFAWEGGGGGGSRKLVQLQSLVVGISAGIGER